MAETLLDPRANVEQLLDVNRLEDVSIEREMMDNQLHWSKGKMRELADSRMHRQKIRSRI